jgi:hypothetical protein
VVQILAVALLLSPASAVAPTEALGLFGVTTNVQQYRCSP